MATKLKITITANLNEEIGPEYLKNIKDFDEQTEHLYEKSQAFLTMLFKKENKVGKLLESNSSQGIKVASAKFVKESNHDYQVFEDNFEISRVTKDVTQ